MSLFSRDFKTDFDISIKEVTEYIESTFDQHYVGESDIQTVDVWENLGIIRQAFQADIIKYSSRYGKKDGLNKKDLLKIIHYTMMLYYYDHIRNDLGKRNSKHVTIPRQGH